MLHTPPVWTGLEDKGCHAVQIEKPIKDNL